jgi:predicted transcriptional regulator
MPECKIIGYFTISGIVEGHPKNLWKQFANVGCIDEESFTEYYAKRDKGYSIKVQDVTVYEKSLNPYELIKGFRPPQSFQHVKGEMNDVFNE